MYFVVLFVPPLYFLLRKRWGGFLVNAFLYVTAMLFVISLIFAWLAILPWALAVGHAVWHFRREMSREMMEQHASLIAVKMAEQVKLASVPNSAAIHSVARAIPNAMAEAARPIVMLSEPAALTFCDNCGAKIDSNSSFCEECGTKIAS